MKTVAFAVASLLFVGSYSHAQMGGMGGMGGQAVPALAPEDKVKLDILELEQEVDKTLLKEALTTLGKEAMKRPSELQGMTEDRERIRKLDLAAIEEQIKSKKASLASRAAEIAEIKERPIKVRREQMQANHEKQPPKPDRLVMMEKMELTNAEIQLLQRQVQLYQEKLTTAIEDLAKAESVLTDGDADTKNSYENAKKSYEKIKTKFVDFGKQLQIEQWKAIDLQQQIGAGGIAGMGGMGGMGGGMR